MDGSVKDTVPIKTLTFFLFIVVIHSVVGQGNSTIPTIRSNADRHHHSPRPWSNNTGTSIIHRCDAFYFEYMEYAGKFMHCELANAVPFRLCGNCISEFSIAHATFEDLKKSPELKPCREKFISGDRIQVFPTVQQNIQNLWDNADCAGCTVNVTVHPVTKSVTFDIPEDILKFVHLFENMTTCVNETTENWGPQDWLSQGKDQNTSVCKECLSQYNAVNAQFNIISDRLGGDMCMDLVDMMNYTRHNWTSTFHCGYTTQMENTSLITTIVLCTTPFIYYILLRITAKSLKKRLMKQKRLQASQDYGTMSGSVTTAGAGPSLSSYSSSMGAIDHDNQLNTRMRRVL